MTSFHVPFTDYPDLLSEALGGQALLASDEFFAGKENLVKAASPVFIPGKYTEFGKWMDGWESRRKRDLGPGNDHDWCVLKLGAPGVIHGFDVDTDFFVGNFPESCSIEACEAAEGASPEALARNEAGWKPIVTKSRLQGGAHNFFPVSSRERWTHLRLRIFPDGGIARLRAYGEAKPDWKALKATRQPLNLASLALGARVIACNDMFFGSKDNLLLPGRAATMGEGWETRRRRGPGHDWIIVKLAVAGRIGKIEIDTNHFKGNFPESCSIEGCSSPSSLEASDFRDRSDLPWKEILPRTKLQGHHEHFFEKELVPGGAPCDYLRLNIFPDGGVSRLRAWGSPE